jgi:hypothetical protein|uniref:Uncharacterized protein n=1 Tax=Burkholderia cepacia TaxID=292 RepID=J9RYZ2_BURCE|nr:hypothetical protein [Burkholderia cepacia]AFR44267.1 hypothetical protein pYS10075 [Burkholderia cepacia]
MKNRFKKRRFYARRATVLFHASVNRLKGMLRKRREPISIESMRAESMNDLLARFDPERHGGEVGGKAVPVGREFGAPNYGSGSGRS